MDHCWGIERWTNTASLDGALSYITTRSLHVPDYCTQFATSEMWIGTNHTTTPSASWWIEEGVSYGKNYDPNAGRCAGGTSPYWFWADSKGPNTYREHSFTAGPPSFGTTYVVKIETVAPGVYYAYRNGNWVGTSNSPCCTRWLEAGGETTANSTTADGEANYLQKKSSSGAWTYDWGTDPTFPKSIGPSSPWAAWWWTAGKYLAYQACC